MWDEQFLNVPTFALVEAQNQITQANVHRIQGVANRVCAAFCTYAPCVSKKSFPNLACYSNKSLFFFYKSYKRSLSYNTQFRSEY